MSRTATAEAMVRTAPLPAVRLVPIAPSMAEAIERLLDLTFGYDRHARTAYRLRAGVAAAPALSCAALDGDGRLVGSLQSWPVALADAAGGATPLWLIGPIAVHPERQGRGIGRAMLGHACRALDAAGDAAMLIGDPAYYGPFGFAATATGGWSLPGPVERHRLLARVAPGVVLPTHGMLGARA